MRLRKGVLVIAALLVSACRGDAQDFQPLAVPAGATPLHCRAVDSAGVTLLTLRLAEVPGPERSITAAFDSLGNPRTVTDWVTERSPSGVPRLDAVAARFEGGVVVGFHRRDSLPAIRRDSTLPPLTAAEAARVAALAQWLWAHRCMRRRP